MMKKRDLILILGVLLLAVVLLLAGMAQRRLLTEPAAAPTESAGASAQPSEPTENAADGSDAVRAAVAAYFEENSAESYLVVTTVNGVHMPIPLNGENELRLTQPDGSENVIRMDRNSFYMASSNCDNQICVQEGEVTLENRETRIMLNMVICLPHNLKLELLSRAETEALLTELYTEVAAMQGTAEGGA